MFDPAEDVETALYELGVGDAVFVGMESGVECALAIAISGNVGVAGMVLVSPKASWRLAEIGSDEIESAVREATETLSEDPEFQGMRDALASGDPGVIAKWMVAQEREPQDPAKRSLYEAMLRENWDRGTSSSRLRSAPRDIGRCVESLSAPVLVVSPEKESDRAVASGLAERLSNADHLVLPTVLPALTLTVPDQFNAALAHFLAQAAST
jgi:pimeloyl-ACP methyl ester carboxylesterase